METDVLEACLLGLPHGRTAGKVVATEVAVRLKASNPMYETLAVEKVEAVIKTVFSIHHNAGARVKFFKVSQRAAERYVSDRMILIRPLKDALEARIGRAVELDRQMRLICGPLSAKGRRKWEISAKKFKWERVLVHVDDVGGNVLQISVPQWNTEKSVHIPVSALPEALKGVVRKGSWMFASATIGAEDSSDLHIRAFEGAPEADPNDGLA
ncbi:MAG TPA: hypothetical protein VM099_16295 [Gemmatimonadaceae bacterium]|nr:hypothetical protein [Gemmatimonadaceae bacterium]